MNRICKEISGYEEARSLTLEDIVKSKYLEYKDDTKSNMIFGEYDEKEYWLASRCVRFHSNYANFRMFYVSGGTADGTWLYDSDGTNDILGYPVLPVLEINL